MSQHTPDPPEPMVAYDHTDLLNRPKRIWNWGNIPLPGLLLPALGAAFGFGLLWLVALISLSAFLPFLGMSMLTSVLYIGPPVAVYFVWGRPLPSALTLSQQLVVWADYWFQPKRLQGLAADREPEELRWQVILWEPGSPRWHKRYAEARTAAAHHGSSYAAHAPAAAPATAAVPDTRATGPVPDSRVTGSVPAAYATGLVPGPHTPGSVPAARPSSPATGPVPSETAG